MLYHSFCRRICGLIVSGWVMWSAVDSSAATANLKIIAIQPGVPQPVCVRAIVKQSDGTYLSGEWGDSSWPAVSFKGKAASPGTILTVPAGWTSITIGKGPDYLPQTITTNLSQANQTYTINVSLQPQLDLYSQGWRAGEAHVHYEHGENEISRTPQDVFTIAGAGGLNYLSLCEEHYGATVLTRQQMYDTWKAFDNSECHIWMGVENPLNQWGHHATILYEPWAIRSAIPYSAGVHDVHEQGGVCYPVHPERWYPLEVYNGTYTLFPLNNHYKNFPLTALTGHLLDGWSGVSDEPCNATTLTSYLKLLSMGYKIPLLCDSDFAFDRINNSGHAMGFWLNYLQLEGNPVSRAALCRAIRKGRLFCTTGPMVLFSIDNAISGDTLPADGAARTLRIQASYQFNPWTLSYSNFNGTAPCSISEIALFRNGQIIQTWNPNTPTALVQQPITETTNNSYYMVRVLGNEGIYMAGYASPIYFENVIRPTQPPVFQPLIQGRLYDAKTGGSLTGLVSCVRYGKTEWTISTDDQGRFRAHAPIDADLIAQDNAGRIFTQNIHKYEPAYAFLNYLPDNYPSDKGPSVEAFSNLVQQINWEFPLGLQLAASYVRTNLSGDAVLTNLAVLSAPAPFSGKTNTEIVMLLVDKTQAQAGDTINYAAVFRQPKGKTPTEELSVAWRGWDPNYPRMFNKTQTVFQYDGGTSGHINLGNGFYMRGGSVVVPSWVTNYNSTAGGLDMLVSVRQGAFLESAHLLLRVGPAKKELLVSSSSDGLPASWGEIGIGPCNFYREYYDVRYADYRNISARLTLNGQPLTLNPTQDTAHVADADDAIFYENLYYDGECEPQYRNIPFRDPIRAQPLPTDFSSVPIQNPPDTMPPTVALMEPLDGEAVSNAPVRLYYYIDDAGLSGAAGATLLLDGSPVYVSSTNNPFLVTPSVGLHTWQIKGFDKAGNWALSGIRTFNVTASPLTNTTPVLQPLAGAPQDRFRIRFDASPGQNYTLQFTTDFNNWTPTSVTNAATNAVTFADIPVTNSFRFYRVLLGP